MIKQKWIEIRKYIQPPGEPKANVETDVNPPVGGGDSPPVFLFYKYLLNLFLRLAHMKSNLWGPQPIAANFYAQFVSCPGRLNGVERATFLVKQELRSVPLISLFKVRKLYVS